jgi:hypothetical protein
MVYVWQWHIYNVTIIIDINYGYKQRTIVLSPLKRSVNRNCMVKIGRTTEGSTPLPSVIYSSLSNSSQFPFRDQQSDDAR